MKRKVIQHGPSTLTISMPSKWTKINNIKKGDELNVHEQNDKLVITFQNIDYLEKLELDVTHFGKMIPRTIHAMYKRGVDELKIVYDRPQCFALIRKSLGKEAIGFEILESGRNYCIITNVLEGSKEFHKVLRQTFMLLLSMAEEGCSAIKQGNLGLLHNLIPLEEANNRFTTFCRRYLNTKGSGDFNKIGPIYYIVETLEKIADYYKYLYQYLTSFKEEIIVLNEELLSSFDKVNKMLRKFYNLYYKFNPKTVLEIKENRDEIVKNLIDISSKIKKEQDIVVYQHMMTLTTLIFSLLGPHLILAVDDSNFGIQASKNL